VRRMDARLAAARARWGASGRVASSSISLATFLSPPATPRLP